MWKRLVQKLSQLLIRRLPEFSYASAGNATHHTRRVLASAEAIARESGCRAVTPNHIWFALVRNNRGVARTVLRELDIDLSGTADEIAISCGVAHSAEEPRSLDESSARMLEYAQEEAKRLNHEYLGTEHLLLGLLRLSDSSAAGYVESRLLSADAVRAAVIDLLGYGIEK